jgi:capsular exopolysaccharide synthesis family protein
MIERLAEEFYEEFHRLDQRLSQDQPKPIRVVQFTGSRFGEGVTSVVLAFAHYLAAVHGAGNVLAVEANLRRPGFHRILNTAADHCLASVLRGTSSVESAIQEVPSLGFSVLVADCTPLDEGDVLHKAAPTQLPTLLTPLRESFEYVLVDSPPVGKVVDAAILSSHVDGVVVVVEANATRQEVLENTIKTLRTNRAHILGLVLNKRDLHIPKWLYRFL